MEEETEGGAVCGSLPVEVGAGCGGCGGGGVCCLLASVSDEPSDEPSRAEERGERRSRTQSPAEVAAEGGVSGGGVAARWEAMGRLPPPSRVSTSSATAAAASGRGSPADIIAPAGSVP